MFRRLAYGYAKSPVPRANYSQLVAKQPVIEQLTALATMLSANTSQKCTPPALSAELVGEAADGTWLIRCIGGSYQFTISDAGTITNVALGPAPNTGSQQTNQPPSASNYSVAVAGFPEGERLSLFATLIQAKNMKCTGQALSAEPFGDASLGIWHVRCTEGSYQVLILENGAAVVTNWTPLDETVAPIPAPQPEFNPDPMAVLAEANPAREAAEQIKTLTRGYEYYGQTYPRESVKDVAFESSQNMLVIVVEDAEEGDPLFAIIPLKIVKVVPSEFSVTEPAIAFRCDPACITTAPGEASEAIEKLSTGRTDEFWKPMQRGEFAIGCDPLRCTDLLDTIEEMVEFARRP